MIAVTGLGTWPRETPTAHAEWPEDAVRDWLALIMDGRNDIRTITFRHNESGRWLNVKRKPIHECPSWASAQITMHDGAYDHNLIYNDADTVAAVTAKINALSQPEKER